MMRFNVNLELTSGCLLNSIDLMTTEFNNACNLAEKGEFHSAIAILEDFCKTKENTEERELTKEPRFLSRCFEALAQCYLEIDKPENAFFAASKSVDLDPSWTTSHITLGRAARNTGYINLTTSLLKSCPFQELL